MKDIAIYGAGGFGKEVACLIKRINEKESTWNLIGFFDDDESIWNKPVSHFGICLGGIAALNYYEKELSIVMAMGKSTTVKYVVDKITNENISFPNIIHPNFEISDSESFEIGKGNIIQANCIATCDVRIGDFNVLNGSVVLGHDVKVGDFNTFMPDCRISGEVQIGSLNFFGVRSTVLQQIKISNSIKLAAGSVLMTKPKEGMLYIGVPAKKTDL